MINEEYYGIKITPIYIFSKNKNAYLYFNDFKYLYKLRDNNNNIQKYICSFHDYNNIYFVSKYYDGLIMNYLNNLWTEEQIQFFSACLILSLENLRKEHLIHRDIHFGNLVLDEKQYIVLIDFHIVIEYQKKNDIKRNIIGSPELCAPEMINSLEYDYNSDYYRLGSMIYYIIFKNYPNFIKKEKNLTEIKIDNKVIKNISTSCIDFINKLIITDKEKRIGFTDIEELKKHDFFKNFNWDLLIKGSMKSPFPKIIRKSLGLCNTNIILNKQVIASAYLFKDKFFKKKLLIYDNVNNEIVDKIIKYNININGKNTINFRCK